MSDSLRESISALIDDEANELEVRRVLSKLNEDENRETWKRYQLARAVMQRSVRLPEKDALKDFDISARVQAALADEPALSADSQTQDEPASIASTQESAAVAKPPARFFKPVVGFAVAASVALVVMNTVVIDPQQPGLEQPVAQTAAPGADTGTVLVASPDRIQALPSAQFASAEGSAALTEAEKRLKALIEQHSEQATLSRGGSFVPHAQAVSFQE